MPELSSLLRQRLGAAGDPKTHPDADTLTAYGEALLPAEERARVLDHISACSQCRAVVALALPDQVLPARKPAVLAIRGRGWRLLEPRFALAGSLLAIAIVLSVVIELPKQSPKPQSTTASATLRQQPASATPVLPTPQTATAEVTRPSAATTLERKSIGAGNHLAYSTKPVPAKAALEHNHRVSAQLALSPAEDVHRDYINEQVFANQLAAVMGGRSSVVQQLPSAPKPALTSDEKPTLGGAATSSSAFLQAPGIPLSQASQSIMVYSLPVPERHGFSITSRISHVGGLRLKRFYPAISSQTVDQYAMFRPGLVNSPQAELSPKHNGKTNNPGTAEDLSQSTAFTSRAMTTSSYTSLRESGSFLWRVNQGKLLKSADMNQWTEAYSPAEGIDFAVVRAEGTEVWAGGSNAALVHSGDGGVTWERITLGSTAGGTINQIEISRSNNSITVTSSSGQTWASHDGGKSWILAN
jgi:hypothetical protein